MDDRERELLDFEENHPIHTTRKEHRILAELDIPPARYYQILIRLSHDPEAVAYAPQALNRVQDRIRKH